MEAVCVLEDRKQERSERDGETTGDQEQESKATKAILSLRLTLNPEQAVCPSVSLASFPPFLSEAESLVFLLMLLFHPLLLLRHLHPSFSLSLSLSHEGCRSH